MSVAAPGVEWDAFWKAVFQAHDAFLQDRRGAMIRGLGLPASPRASRPFDPRIERLIAPKAMSVVRFIDHCGFPAFDVLFGSPASVCRPRYFVAEESRARVAACLAGQANIPGLLDRLRDPGMTLDITEMSRIRKEGHSTRHGQEAISRPEAGRRDVVRDLPARFEKPVVARGQTIRETDRG